MKLIRFAFVSFEPRPISWEHWNLNVDGIDVIFKTLDSYLTGYFGKIVIIMDNAPQHKASIVQKFIHDEPNVKVI